VSVIASVPMDIHWTETNAIATNPSRNLAAVHHTIATTRKHVMLIQVITAAANTASVIGNVLMVGGNE